MGSLNDPALPHDELMKISSRLGEIAQLLDEKQMRWLELSELM